MLVGQGSLAGRVERVEDDGGVVDVEVSAKVGVGRVVIEVDGGRGRHPDNMDLNEFISSNNNNTDSSSFNF